MLARGLCPVSFVRHLEAPAGPALEKLPGGTGIVLDDAWPGIYAALVLLAAGWFNRLVVALRKKSSGPQISEVTPARRRFPAANFRFAAQACSAADQRPSRSLRRRLRARRDRLGFADDRQGARRRAREANSRSAASDDVAWTCDIGIQIADELHPVANPVVDVYGNIYTTISGSAGPEDAGVDLQDRNQPPPPSRFVTDMMNATGLALDTSGLLYVSSRHDGIVYQVSPSGNAVDLRRRHGRRHRHRLRPRRQPLRRRPQRNDFQDQPRTARFTCSPRSSGRSPPIIWRSALTDILYVTGPTTSSFDVSIASRPTARWKRLLSRPGPPAGHGVRCGRQPVCGRVARRAVAVSCASRPTQQAELFLSGPDIVGLAFTPSKSMIAGHQQLALPRGRGNPGPYAAIGRWRTPRSSQSGRSC